MDGTGETEDQKRNEKISDEARAAIDENCLAWVRKVIGNPKAIVSPLSQERVYEIGDLVWSLAYRAGREDAAREAVDLLADMVVKCTEYGTQEGDFVASYLLPTGPVHRAIPWLDQRGINVRPGFDGRTQR